MSEAGFDVAHMNDRVGRGSMVGRVSVCSWASVVLFDAFFLRWEVACSWRKQDPGLLPYHITIPGHCQGRRDACLDTFSIGGLIFEYIRHTLVPVPGRLPPLLMRGLSRLGAKAMR